MRFLRLLPALALALATLPAQAMERPLWGGLGYMSQGWMMGDVAGAGDGLGDAAPGMGLSLGGGGMALLGGLVALRGQGQALIGLAGGGPGLDVDSFGGGGGLSVGIAALNRNNDLLIPYVGVAMHGSELHVMAGSEQTTAAGIALEPGERRHLEGGGLAVDIGAQALRLFWGKDSGGMALGGELGAWIPVSGGDWSDSGGGTPTGLGTGPAGIYLRMNLGGGGAYRG